MAETAELILTLKAVGMDDRAAEMLGWLDRQRDEQGAYWIGYEYDSEVFWPVGKAALDRRGRHFGHRLCGAFVTSL